MASSNGVSEIVGINVRDLRMKVGLTMEGLAFALQISISYLIMIEKGTANISSKLAKRFALFFGIEDEELYSRKEIKLKKGAEIPTVSNFYKSNANNLKFFIDKKGEYSVAYFLRNILLKEVFMLSEHDAKEIREYCMRKYKREFNSQEISRELRRLYLKGILNRKSKFGNGSVYMYWVEKTAS